MKKNKLIYVPIITLIIGFLPFMTLSIYYHVFWITSKYDVPLIYNVSVMLGDSIVLPIINYKIIDLVFNYLYLDKIKKNIRIICIYIIICIIVSFIMNISTHIYWVNDKITDFVGFQQGEFSLIGYWHLIYSIIQMFLLLLFPLLWFLSIKENVIQAIKYSHKIWRFILLFSTFGIFDMLNKYLFIYKNKSFIYALEIDKFAFSATITSLLIFLIMRYFENNKFIKQISHK